MGLLGSLGDFVPSVDPEAWIAPTAVVVGRVTIGRAANIWYGAVLRADDDEIVVGPECNIQDLCCMHVDAGEPAVLEERVSLGHHATVHGAHVGAGALIGMGAIVLGGARVGAGTLVAAGEWSGPARASRPGFCSPGYRAGWSASSPTPIARRSPTRPSTTSPGPVAIGMLPGQSGTAESAE